MATPRAVITSEIETIESLRKTNRGFVTAYKNGRLVVPRYSTFCLSGGEPEGLRGTWEAMVGPEYGTVSYLGECAMVEGQLLWILFHQTNDYKAVLTQAKRFTDIEGTDPQLDCR